MSAQETGPQDQPTTTEKPARKKRGPYKKRAGKPRRNEIGCAVFDKFVERLRHGGQARPESMPSADVLDAAAAALEDVIASAGFGKKLTKGPAAGLFKDSLNDRLNVLALGMIGALMPRYRKAQLLCNKMLEHIADEWQVNADGSRAGVSTIAKIFERLGRVQVQAERVIYSLATLDISDRRYPVQAGHSFVGEIPKPAQAASKPAPGDNLDDGFAKISERRLRRNREHHSVGSTRWRGHGHYVVEHCVKLDIGDVAAHGLWEKQHAKGIFRCKHPLKRGVVVNVDYAWEHPDETIPILHLQFDVLVPDENGEQSTRRVKQSIRLSACSMPNTALKWLFECPLEGGNCKQLLLPPNAEKFGSQKGHGLNYASQIN